MSDTVFSATDDFDQEETAPDYAFGPIENKQSRIIGLQMICTKRLPPEVEKLVEQVMGVPTIQEAERRAWKLKHTMSYIDDEWRWLLAAFMWASDTIGEPVTFTELLDPADLVETLLEAEGPLIEMTSTGPIGELIDEYRRARNARKVEPPKKTAKDDKGYQRLLYRAWNIRDDNLKPIDKFVLFAILRYCWSKNQCEVWEQTLADDCLCSVRTLQRSLAALVKYKYIKVTNRPRHKSVYRVLHKDLIPPYPKKHS